MQRRISLRLRPGELADPRCLLGNIAKTAGKKVGDITGYTILKKSIDARAKTVWINLTVTAFINEPFQRRIITPFHFQNVHQATKSVVIIGGGPAGLFAALQLLEIGIKPIILERGKNVKDRRRDLALLNKKGIINPESNYCFGEGGAGTYSDGKLYTRSNKRGNIDRILHLFVHFNADESILYEAHPHIGTNKLPQIITEMRTRILACGGECHFNQKLTDFVVKNDTIISVKTDSGDSFAGDSFILATGHSARDIFVLLHTKKIALVAKPFALGVRVEHPQELINTIQYHQTPSPTELLSGDMIQLPPASYSLVEQVDNRGVFSFCMCPGGIIAPAATENGEIVVNGWSPSKRNNPFANSGIVVQVETDDVVKYRSSHKSSHPVPPESPLMMMYFQQEIEKRAFAAGGGHFVAPAQRMVDFTRDAYSSTLPKCSYLPGIESCILKDVLPAFIHYRLQKALQSFGHKMPGRSRTGGFFTNEAVLVATESRTSSPVRIPRDDAFLFHPQLKNLFPCGEGAGYAGGIVSAAMDGQRVALAVHATMHR